MKGLQDDVQLAYGRGPPALFLFKACGLQVEKGDSEALHGACGALRL